jgi:hypothetical protein
MPEMEIIHTYMHYNQDHKKNRDDAVSGTGTAVK